MDGAQAAEAHDPVKPGEHAVQIVCDIVSGGKDVARIEAYAEPRVAARRIQDRGDLLERAADLAALPGHGFHKQRDIRRCGGGERLPEQCPAQTHARCGSLPGMAARMEVVQPAGQHRQARKVIRHGHLRKLAHARIRRTGVERIWRMRHRGRKAVFALQRVKRRRIRRVNGLCAAAARVARKELERIRADGERVAPHGKIAVRGGQMAADVHDGQGSPFQRRAGVLY